MALRRIARVLGLLSGTYSAGLGLLYCAGLSLWAPLLAPLYVLVFVGPPALGLLGALVVKRRPVGGALLMLGLAAPLVIETLHSLFYPNPNGGGEGLFVVMFGVPAALCTLGSMTALASRWTEKSAPGMALAVCLTVILLVGPAALARPSPKEITGAVYWVQGNVPPILPVSGARVVFEHVAGRLPGSPARYEVASDRDGRFGLRLPRGSYRRVVTHDAFERDEGSFYVNEEGLNLLIDLTGHRLQDRSP